MLPYRILLLLVIYLLQRIKAEAEAEISHSPGQRFGGFPFQQSASSSSSHSGKCALLIPGHGKSSKFDQTLNVFNGIQSPHSTGGDVTCITFQSVSAAFIAARDKFGLPRPMKPATKVDIGRLGRVLFEATRIIAKQYSLPKDVIINGLPLINSLKSIVGSICFDFVKNKKCEVERYRTYDGSCNNLKNPNLGAALTPFKRRIGPDYVDGVDEPRISKSGHPLPSARAVSAHIHRDEGLHDHAVTIMSVAWGQAIDHDFTLTAETKLPDSMEDPRCCDRDANFPDCFPIRVSQKDAFYSLFKQDCLNVVRSIPGITGNCKFGPRVQINEVSSYIDGNWVYGSTVAVVERLRLFKGGLLKTIPVFKEFGMKDLLPLKIEAPEEGCIRPNDELFCFDAGDGRVNEQLVLAVVHTLMVREHNRIAIELTRINPHWDDEKLYQETRHIVAAQIQHITYNEFLPMTLGKDVMQKFGLILEKHGFFTKYDPSVDPSMASDFITSAFRFGHSLLPSTIERWSPAHKYIGSQRLSEMLRQPYDLYKGGWCDQFMMGLCNQVAQAMDDAVTQEVTNHLFQEPANKFGMDLAALNMQRGREHGVPSYNEFRHLCGLQSVRSWRELEGVMPNKTVKRYVDIYETPDDIDLWSGGVSERPLPGALVGPTFACLIGLTFKEVRFGDRFWYENKGYPSSFTPAQLEEIRKIKLSRIVCDNSDDIKTVQVYVMVLPDHDINPRVPCASGILPRIDLSPWREHSQGGSHRHPQNYDDSVTENEYETLPPSIKNQFQISVNEESGPPQDFSPGTLSADYYNLKDVIFDGYFSKFLSQDVVPPSPKPLESIVQDAAVLVYPTLTFSVPVTEELEVNEVNSDYVKPGSVIHHHLSLKEPIKTVPIYDPSVPSPNIVHNTIPKELIKAVPIYDPSVPSPNIVHNTIPKEPIKTVPIYDPSVPSPNFVHKTIPKEPGLILKRFKPKLNPLKKLENILNIFNK